MRDSELHAYVDGQLESARRHEVETWLAGDQEAACRVDAYRTQNAALHALFDPVLREPLEGRLADLATQLGHQLERQGVGYQGVGYPGGAIPVRRRWAQPAWSRLAASIALVAVGLGGGWFGHDLLTETVSAAIERAEPMSFADEAAQAHTFYVNSRFEVEMGADDQEALNNWLSERLGRAVFGPDLTANGYRLIGGRSLPAESGTVAQYVYDGADGTRLTLLVGEVKPGRKSAVGYVRHGEVGSFHWVEGPLSYALVGRIERDQLMAMAQAIHKQFKGDPIDRRAARPAPAPPPVAAPKPALKPETKPETKPEVVPSPSPAGPALPSPAVPDDQAQPKAS